MTIIATPDGRRLDIEVSGPADGLPLLFHHGTPGSLVQSRGLARDVHGRGLRLVTWSRPGYGSSTRRAGRQVIDVVDDVTTILDHLDAPRCVTAGQSGGGPHAIATGAGLPDRVGGVLVLSGAGPYVLDSGPVPGLDFLAGMGEQNIDEFGRALDGEVPLREFLEAAAPGLREADAAGLIEEVRTLLPPVDVAVVTDEYGEDVVASFHEALRAGVDGWLDDDLAFTRPWGFDLMSLSVPAFVWQGEEDLMVPFAHGQWLAANLPGAVAHLEPGQGHLSVARANMGRALDELLAAG